MTKDEMKNRISMALTDPILQQGFEIICKENAELKHQLEHRNCLDCSNHSSNLRMRNLDLEKENAELNKKLSKAEVDYYKMFWNKNEIISKAKEIIENIIRVTWGEGWNYSLDWKVKAEQFLKEVSE